MKKSLLQLSVILLTLTSINSFGQTVSTIGQTSETPSGIAVDATGNVYIAERSPGSKISKLNQATGISTVFSNLGITDPMDIEFGPNNDVFVADYGGNVILRVPSTGGAASVYVSGASSPSGVVFDADTLYFIEYVSQIVYKVLPGGGAVGSASVIQISDSALWMNAGARGLGLLFLPDGNLLVTAANGGNNLYVVDKNTGSIISESDCADLAVFNAVQLSDGKYYLPGLQTHKIYQWSGVYGADATPYFGNGADTSANGSDTIASFSGSYFIAKDQSDNLYVTDANSKKIRKITNAIVSVNEFESTQIKVFPNPSSSHINIQLSRISKINIISLEGKIISKLLGADNYQVNVESLENGIYFIQTENGTTQKFIKQ
jgi:hypothetical protein